jgi:hypothetical protein
MSNVHNDYDGGPVRLENITHVMSGVSMRWGSHELDLYINQILMDSRDGERQGFPMEVADDLLFLQAVNKIRRAQEIVQRSSIPFQEAFRLVEIGDHHARFGSDDPWLSAANTGAQLTKTLMAQRGKKTVRHRSGG